MGNSLLMYLKNPQTKCTEETCHFMKKGILNDR